MYQMSLFEQTHVRKSDPIQCHTAARKIEPCLAEAQKHALEMIKANPGLTRKEWRMLDPDERVCKRAKELELKGKIYRIQDTITGEYRIYPNEIH